MIMENVGRVFLCKNIQIFMHFCIKCIYALIEMFLEYRIGCKGAVLVCVGGGIYFASYTRVNACAYISAYLLYIIIRL